jgi:hypothetical protein
VPSVPASASAEQAAAIVAALERFMRATAPSSGAGAAEPRDAWSVAAILEGISREHLPDAGDPWINT